MSCVRPSPFVHVSATLRWILLMVFGLSPLTLFAQELSLSPIAQAVEERIPESPDVRRDQSPMVTYHQRNSGNVIAVVKVTVKDNDVGTANEERTELPEELLVQDNYPNPFRNATRIVFHLPEQAQVYTEVFDILGRVIYTSQMQQVNAGWDRVISLDLPTISSGMYIYRVNVTTASGTFARTGRMIQIR